MDDAGKTQRQLIDELTRLRQRIVELEQAETRRQQTQESYQVLVEHSLQGMAIYQNGRVVFANARLAEILGRPVEALQAMLIDNGGLAELVHPDDQPRIRGYLRDRAEGKPEPLYYEVRVLHPNQDVRWVEIQTVAIDYADRPAVQAVLVDITERKRAEERLRYQANLLQNVSDAIISSDLDFKIASWNKAAEDLYGWRAEEVIDKPIHQILQSVYPGYSWDTVTEGLLAQGYWEGEIIQSRKDGVPIHIYARASQVKDETGKRIGAVTINRDITERKQAEQELRAAQANLNALMENTTDYILISDEQGFPVIFNTAYARIMKEALGIEMRPGLKPHTLLPDPESVAWWDNLHKRVLGGESFRVQYSLELPPKGLRHYEFSYHPIVVDGEVKGFSELSRDITEREQMAEALRESQAVLTEAQRIGCMGNWVHYLDTDELCWSDELYRIFGREREDLDLDQNFLWIHPDDRERVREAGAAYVQEKGRMDIEYRIIREDGEERIIHSQGEVICDDRGNVLKTVGTVQDVTEQREAEKALHQSYYLLERSQHLANLGSWQWDLSTDRVAWSRQMHRIHGTDPDQYPDGVPFDEVYRFIHPDDRQLVQDKAQKVVEQGTGAPFEYRIVRPNGEVRRLFVDGRAVGDESGNPVRILGMVQDITERKQAEEQALALLGERERSRILAQFIQDASHEFRTPLSMIGLNAHAARGMTDPVQRIERLQRIEGLVRNITGLVDNLVTMARLDSGVPLKMGAINIGEIVGHVRATMQDAISEARLQVFSESTIPDGLMIQGNLDYLYQAIASILDNAIRYTAPGGTITLRTYPRADQVVLEVQDTGSGIDDQTLPHIFERFYRADQAHSTSGFGLGLPIAQKIIERHGGQIEVESEVVRGSVFRLVLNV